MRGGWTTARTEGTPQGGLLSPLLSNILLDDLDKELERRGHAFCHYADDCNIYVRTRRAGERVMSSMCRFLAERLRLTVNLAKSAVDRPWKRSFLGFSVTAHREPRLKVAAKSMGRLREKLRDLFRQGAGTPSGTPPRTSPRSCVAGRTISGWCRPRGPSRISTDGCGGRFAASCGANGSDRAPEPRG